MNSKNTPSLGNMSMPSNFKYAKCFFKGRPIHNGDDFSIKHPPMSVSKWAKIFSPFDALKGFSDTIKETENNSGGS